MRAACASSSSRGLRETISAAGTYSGDGGWSYSDGEADLDFEFSPAIDSRARSLDIILTGSYHAGQRHRAA